MRRRRFTGPGIGLLLLLVNTAGALTGRLTGHVRDTAGTGVPYVYVSAFSPTGTSAAFSGYAGISGEYTLDLDYPGLDSAAVRVMARGGVNGTYGYQYFDSAYAVSGAQILTLHDGETIAGVDLTLGPGAQQAGQISGGGNAVLPFADLSGELAALWADPSDLARYAPLSFHLLTDYNALNGLFLVYALNPGRSYDLGAAVISGPLLPGQFSLSLRDYNLGVPPGMPGLTLENPSVAGVLRGWFYRDHPDSLWAVDGVGVAVNRGLHEIAVGTTVSQAGEFLLPGLVPDEYQLHAAIWLEGEYWWGADFVLHVPAGDTLEVGVELRTMPPGIESGDPPAPSAARLIHGFPNPFNGAMVFILDIPCRVPAARLDIFNLQGRGVEAWSWQDLPSGSRRLEWKPQDLPAGVYLYRFTTGNYTVTDRCVYLK
ncbi:MAG: T9SS C-terminal target domain-containing protein [Candidatus Zixiibacteriota bacterium]|nr:MAG: T9SS C-terminal target domain-containing protein [candidate division Zixibacteria bacterium]